MLTFFGGKGGVGKTTCAAAWGLARASDGARVLVLSTDPAHSLADAFGKPLRTHAPSIVAPGLSACELDSERVIAGWMRRRRAALTALLDRGTLLDRDDIAQVLSLPLPGLDELAAFVSIAEYAARGDYEEIVVDTAPTGHALRLLDTATIVGAFTELLQAMHDRHATVAQALGGVVGTNVLVEELRQLAAGVQQMLHDRAQTQFLWVTLPEPITIAETVRAIEWLHTRAFPLTSVVVNRATLPSGRESCVECRARVAFERMSLEPLADALREFRPAVPFRRVHAAEQEPRGMRLLRAIGHDLCTTAPRPFAAGKPAGRSNTVRPQPARENHGAPVLGLSSAHLVFFAGKGGVGKTTCATAAALAIGARFPTRPVRLLSTDPASSLGDALSLSFGDDWTAVPGTGRLAVRELDAPQRFAEYRRRYSAAVDDFFDRLRGGSAFDAVADRRVFARLFDLAPPGIDELMALVTVLDLLEDEPDSLVIVDTAPTGHALRLLSAQEDLRRWLALLMRIVLKYQLAARAEAFAQDLVELSRRLRAFSALLANPARTQLVAVVRPAALPRLETVRLLAQLRRLRVRTPVLIVNAETSGTCRRCRRRVIAEAREVRELRRSCRGKSGRCDIIHAPLQLPPPRGATELLQWSTTWRSDGDP